MIQNKAFSFSCAVIKTIRLHINWLSTSTKKHKKQIAIMRKIINVTTKQKKRALNNIFFAFYLKE